MGWLFVIVGLLFVLGGIVALLTLFDKKPQSQSERIEEVYDNKISTDINPVAAKVQTIASKARTVLSNQINIEADSYNVKIQKENDAKLAEVERKTLITEHQTTQSEFEAKQFLISKALEKSWDVGTYLEMEKAAETNRLELKKQWETAEQSLKAGFIYQLKAQQHLLLLTEYISGLYDKSREYKKKRKDRELKLIEEHITFMEDDFRGRQRLLQTSEQNILEGSDEDIDIR